MPYIPIDATMYARPDLSWKAKAVFGYLRWRQGRKQVSWPGRETIAADCGITVAAARRAMAELESKGLIFVSRTPGTTSKYTINPAHQQPGGRRTSSQVVGAPAADRSAHQQPTPGAPAADTRRTRSRPKELQQELQQGTTTVEKENSAEPTDATVMICNQQTGKTTYHNQPPPVGPEMDVVLAAMGKQRFVSLSPKIRHDIEATIDATSEPLVIAAMWRAANGKGAAHGRTIQAALADAKTTSAGAGFQAAKRQEQQNDDGHPATDSKRSTLGQASEADRRRAEKRKRESWGHEEEPLPKFIP